MRSLILISLLGLALAKVDYSGHQVYRIYPNEITLKVIKDAVEYFQLDVWSDAVFLGDFMDFRVSPQQKSRIDILLARNKMEHEIFIEDVELAMLEQTRPRPEQKLPGDFDYEVYHTYAEINDWVDDFTSDHSMATAVNVGTGKSLGDRNIRAVKISTGAGRDAYVINCGLHSREWVTPATCMYTANQLIADYNTDQGVTDLLNSIDFYLIPTANPDGYEYTWTDDRMWRKTRSSSSTNGCLTNCDGVDPNRNFGDHWSNPSEGASDNCCSDQYRGPSAFSEIETQNQRDFVEDLANVTAYIDVHAYSQMWMFPYGWSYSNPADYDDLLTIGQASKAAIFSVHNKVFDTGTIANTIYIATGSSADYFYDVTGIKCSFAAELRDKGQYGFALPANQIIPAAEEAYAGLLTIADYILDGTCG